jgi:hemoglobin
MMLRDIETRDDIERLMREFYSVAMTDAEIGHHFVELDLEEHLPKIVDFWEKALFGRPVYFNNPLAVHQRLHEKVPMKTEHFRRWVEIFVEKVNLLFVGEIAEAAKLKARMVADSFDQRLNLDSRFHQVDISRLTR